MRAVDKKISAQIILANMKANLLQKGHVFRSFMVQKWFFLKKMH